MMDIELYECSKCKKTIGEDDVAFDATEPAPELRHPLDLLNYLSQEGFDILCPDCLKLMEKWCGI